MKFQVGDKVRLTREAILEKVRCKFIIEEELIDGAEVREIKNYQIFYKDSDYNTKVIHESYLELVPEEPEFEYGEEIEVWDWSSDKWYKRIFIYKIPGKVGIAYACVSKHKEGDFKSGKTFEVDLRKTVRKLRPQLTRKEIAEKFGVSLNFELIEE